MDIAIHYGYREDDVRALFDVEELVRLVVESQNCPDATEVSISFVTDEEIHELNRDYRGIDRPTDVLSFECDGAPTADDAPLLDGMAFELGDIFVAVDIAEAQAPGFGLTFADEMSLLITHGLLHLCGFDHMEPDEAEVMEARETELLTAFWGRAFKRGDVEGQS